MFRKSDRRPHLFIQLDPLRTPPRAISCLDRLTIHALTLPSVVRSAISHRSRESRRADTVVHMEPPPPPNRASTWRPDRSAAPPVDARTLPPCDEHGPPAHAADGGGFDVELRASPSSSIPISGGTWRTRAFCHAPITSSRPIPTPSPRSGSAGSTGSGFPRFPTGSATRPSVCAESTSSPGSSSPPTCSSSTGAGYWLARSADAALWAAAIAFVLMTVNSGPRMIEFAYLAMSAELAILEAADRGNKRLLWLLPPLFCLWINLHGTWLVGHRSARHLHCLRNLPAATSASSSRRPSPQQNATSSSPSCCASARLPAAIPMAGI